MSKQADIPATPESVQKQSPPRERLNFIIAVCAILISAASFYATYLQADAANKQVKAMTMPMLQYGHGNVLNDDERVVNFSLINAGVGPALINSVTFSYQDRSFDTFFQVLNHCCQQVVKDFLVASEQRDEEVPQFITSPVLNTILPGQDRLMFMRLKWHESNQEMWNLINELRFEVTFQACYCSLLDECYQTDEQSRIKAVASCPVNRKN